MAEEELNPGTFRVESGHLLTKGLFFEMADDRSTVVYTLKPRDHNGYKSLYLLYMEMDDPTEYTFATTYLDGWDHWERLCKCSWFKPIVAKWRHELEVRTKARALIRLRHEAEGGGRNAAAINKFLIQGGYKDKPGKGRPSKEAIEKEAAKLALETADVEDDFKRIMN